ncbi:MAG: OmpA family protein [Myxococcales bacterium]
MDKGIRGWLQGLLAALALAVGAPLEAHAQVALDHYRPAPLATDGFGTSRADGLGHLKFGAQLQLDYGHDPLVLRTAGGSEMSIVSDQLVGHAAFALGLFDKLTLFAGLPVQLSMKGDGSTDGAGLGDVWLGGRFTFLGGPKHSFRLGAEAIANLPTAQWSDDQQRFSGDDIGSYDLALMIQGNIKRLVLGLRPGVRLRKQERIDDSLQIGDELLFSGYAQLRLIDALSAYAEVFGNTAFDAFFQARSTPVEALFGLKAWISDFMLGFAAGPGLSRGYGAAEYRLVGTLGYAQRATSADKRDLDPDRDGVREPWDSCPTEREDRDGFEDKDGCPDADNDGDGLLDTQDRCPNEPEDRDGFGDDDGCLDADNDGDDLLDADDRCPLETEDKDGFQDDDGCLDRDNDGDGVPDVDDKCPNQAGTVEQMGCPAPAPPPPPARPPVAVLEKGEIKIRERIEFAVNKDSILPGSTPVLEAVEEVLKAHPEVKRLRVEGHTDSRGGEARNMELSRKRAASVTRWLVEHGIEAERLESVGCGPRRPREPNITAGSRRKNRRVEFHLVDPAPAQGVDASMCKAAPR